MLRPLWAAIPALLLASLPVAAEAPPSPDTVRLERCLAHVANNPEFSGRSSEALGSDGQFAKAAKDYCGDEISPLWKVVHGRARQQMGLPANGPPAYGQQALAEREMDAIILGAWPKASTMRAEPPALGRQRLTRYVMVWLLKDGDDAQMIDETAVLCARDRLRKNPLPQDDLAPLLQGKFSPTVTRLIADCGYPAWRDRLGAILSARFPAEDPALRADIANWYIGQMTFWAMLSEG
ncbi:MAG: hypothetical protein J0L50_02890 [Sphingomonadales bacterium]|nr:hypothetical protein [Sphingomonadales bacterium]